MAQLPLSGFVSSILQYALTPCFLVHVTCSLLGYSTVVIVQTHAMPRAVRVRLKRRHRVLICPRALPCPTVLSKSFAAIILIQDEL
ncbi:hypothetical protein F5888DRAFT_1710642 [Russula emetica]|nr:hypothetical protein F5888DRAFT_1710642 [Russula emetica]